MGTTPSYLSKTQEEKLQEIMEPKFGLLTKLLIGDSISLDEKEKIDSQQSTSDKNKMLFRIIRERGKLKEFRDALQESGQIHVIKWIEGNGEYRSMFGLDWPLTSRENYSIAGSYELLCDLLDAEFSRFVETLRSKSILNKEQMELIKSKATNYERVQTFLDILRRFSLKTYFLMISRLQKSDHSHIAIILENVIVPVHIHLEEQNVDELEKQLVREVVKLCLENKASTAEQADVRSSLADLRMNIIAAKRGDNIVLYARCSNTKEFHCLCTMVDNDETRKPLEKLFQLLLKNTQTNVLSVTILENDRKRVEKAFRCESLRDKMLDEHLRRLRSQLNNDETMEIPVVKVQVTKEEEEEQKKLENETERHTICIRRWYTKLLSSLTMIPEIVAEMFEKEKISDSELERLQSYQDTPVRASKELLGLLISSSVEVYESFLESLRSTKQEHIYLLLTLTSDEFETDMNTISEHSILIRRNYRFLITTLDVESKLLDILFQNEVLNQREYEQISRERDRFRKSEALLSLISRKSDNDFQLFKEALRDANLGFILEELGICLPEEPIIVLAEDKHEGEPICEADNHIPEPIGQTASQVETNLTTQTVIKSLIKTSEEILIKQEKSVTLWLTKCRSFHDDLQNEIFIKKTILQKEFVQSNESIHFGENQENMEQELSRMQREAEKDAFNNGRMEWEKEKEKLIESLQNYEKTLKGEKESSEKLRMEWEKEKEKHIESLQKSEIDLKREKESCEKLRVEWKKEKEKYVDSLQDYEKTLKGEKESSEKLRMEWEKEKEKHIESLQKSEINLKKEKESSEKSRMEWEKEKEKLQLMAVGLSINMGELENNFHNTREFLKEYIDPDFVLIDELHSRGILNKEEMLNIKAEETYIMRNSLLLEIISKKKKILELCVALKEEGQQHVINYLKASGKRSPQFDDDWPLTKKEDIGLSELKFFFDDDLDTRELIDRLCSRGVINRRHVEFVSSKSTSSEKNKALFEILKRCNALKR